MKFNKEKLIIAGRVVNKRLRQGQNPFYKTPDMDNIANTQTRNGDTPSTESTTVHVLCYCLLDEHGSPLTGYVFAQPEHAESAPYLSIYNGKWGYVDMTGKKAIRHKYADARPFCEGFAAVTEDGSKWKIIGRNGRRAITCYFDYVSECQDGVFEVERLGMKYGIPVEELKELHKTILTAHNLHTAHIKDPHGNPSPHKDISLFTLIISPLQSMPIRKGQSSTTTQKQFPFTLILSSSPRAHL